MLDGADLSHVDPAWLRSHIGVVEQHLTLFGQIEPLDQLGQG